jgi:anti-sigma factor RsiW
MTSHVLEWLAAYHDGELTPNRQRLVEEHLQDCPTCRAELDAIEGLSSLLKADLVPQQTPPQRFAAQVQLRLSRITPLPRRSADQLPRWVLGAPFALIVVWAFLQAALWVTSFILTADWALGQRAELFNRWIESEGLFESIGNLLLLNAALLVGTTVLWGTWMAFWLAWKQNLVLKPSSNRIQKEV